MRRCTLRTNGDRRGSAILEIVVCAALLAALFAVTSKALVAARRQARAIDRRAEATVVIENLMEQVVGRPWGEIDEGLFARLELPESLLADCPEATLSGSVHREETDLPSKRIILELDLDGDSTRRPIVLTTWIYQRSTP